MKKLIGPVALLSFLFVGILALRSLQPGVLITAAEQQTLRDAPGEDAPNGALPSLPKLNIAGVRGSDWGIREGKDEDGKPYRHIVNTQNFVGVYMTRNKHVSGFVDILRGKDGFCEGDMVSFRTRAMDKDGKPIVLGVCLAPPTNGVMLYDYAGCSFKVSLMRDAQTSQAMTYLNVMGGGCSDVGTGHADLAAMNGVGFWMLQP